MIPKKKVKKFVLAPINEKNSKKKEYLKKNLVTEFDFNIYNSDCKFFFQKDSFNVDTDTSNNSYEINNCKSKNDFDDKSINDNQNIENDLTILKIYVNSKKIHL